jgi:TnpA family transposase
MTAIHETAYPRIRSNITDKELETLYTPSELEIKFAASNTQAPVQKLGLLVLLKTFQRLGYFPMLPTIPRRVIRHIATSAGLEDVVADLENYELVGSRKKHLPLIRDWLHIKAFRDGGQPVLVRALENACQTKDIIADIINAGIEELVHYRYELPGFSSLNRAARDARSVVNREFYQNVYDSLSSAQRALIERLLERNESETHSQWHRMKQEPKKVTTKNFRQFIEHLLWLVSLNGARESLEQIPEAKLQRFSDEAFSLNVAQMNATEATKRFTLAVALIRTQTARSIDDLTEMYLRSVAKLHRRGRDALLEYHSQNREKTDQLITILSHLVSALDPQLPATEQISAMTDIIGDDAEKIAQECEVYLGFSGNNYLPFLPGFYRNRRRNFFRFLELLRPKSTSSDVALEEAITFGLEHKNSRAKFLDVTVENQTDKKEAKLDLSWIPSKWWKLVTGKTSRDANISRVDRRYFEICLFSQVWLELKSGDLYIDGSEKFGDWRNQLIDKELLDDSLDAYCQQIGCPKTAEKFVESLKVWLSDTIQKVDATFPENESVSIKDGEPVIRKHTKRSMPEGFAAAEKLIAERMPEKNIIDVLSDTEHWLNWTLPFRPVSGYEARIRAPRRRYITTTFCYGCNLGPTQTEKSVEDFDRRQVAYVNNRHIDEDKLLRANVHVINQYNKFLLPTFWGKGESASADGTKWDVYEQNLLSEYHIRYGGWGGIGYYHVSDTYIALFSNFISCGVWEAIHILDGLIENESEIRPDTLHSDTQGQSEPVFGLAYLLNIQLMPRIRNWKDLKFYFPDEELEMSHLNALFSDTIDWQLIETHFFDMLQVAISISQGKIRSSTILRKLGTYSRKNRLYFAFRELGRVVRTVFLLNYIASIELRRMIFEATQKSESWNQFIQWIAFGGEEIRENNRKEQRKIIRYNHLVANLVIFHNVVEMTRVIKQLVAEGVEITPEILAGLSPYKTGHLNRFGRYRLEFEKVPDPIPEDFDFLF